MEDIFKGGDILPTIAGWIGMLFILVAYYLISNKKITGESRIYQLLNLLGGQA